MINWGWVADVRPRPMNDRQAKLYNDLISMDDSPGFDPNPMTSGFRLMTDCQSARPAGPLTRARPRPTDDRQEKSDDNWISMEDRLGLGSRRLV